MSRRSPNETLPGLESGAGSEGTTDANAGGDGEKPTGLEAGSGSDIDDDEPEPTQRA